MLVEVEQCILVLVDVADEEVLRPQVVLMDRRVGGDE